MVARLVARAEIGHSRTWGKGGSNDCRAGSTAGWRARARRAQAAARYRLLRTPVRVVRVDHWRRLAIWRPVRVLARRAGRGDLLGDRRRGADAPRLCARRARWHVP